MPETTTPTEPGFYWATWVHKPRVAGSLTVVLVERWGDDLLVWEPHRVMPEHLDAWIFVAGPLDPPALDAPEQP